MKTKFYKNCDAAELTEVADILKNGGLVAIPMETVSALRQTPITEMLSRKCMRRRADRRITR